MWYFLAALAGLGLGTVLGWLLAAVRASAASGARAELERQQTRIAAELAASQAALSAEREARARAETLALESRRQLDEERALLAQSKKQLSETFQALAGSALNANNEAFLKLAGESFGKTLLAAKGDLGQRQEAIGGLVKPLAEALQRFEERVRDLEQKRTSAYTSLDEHLKTLTQAHQGLQKETANLVTALRRPQVRGQWGELTLRRTVELAGLSPHCDFSEQVSVTTDSGRLRPDLVVHLPANRELVVDAKAPLDAYLSAIEATSEEQRREHLQRHAQQCRAHLNSLGAKAYWEQFTQAPEIVVMFVPSESFLAAAVEQDRQLLEYGLERRVVVATPTTLVALLRAVAFGWRQEQIAESAREISRNGKDLYERMIVLTDHVREVGRNLERAAGAYNRAVASLESRVLPAARRFRELAPDKELAALEPVETALRQPAPPASEDPPTTTEAPTT